MLKVKKGENYLELELKVQPRSSANKVVGVEQGRLKVKVTVPPEKGKANQTVVELLAKSLKVPKRNVTIVRGETSRVKTVRLEGVDVATLQKNLGIKGVEIS
ncbi:DUF167 domain-containing protein [Thermovibrio ammonificans]|uniref:DUF167 domain-containing protein n=1 Tax=Thermovibrio ammonificans TaxID=228745 RepID=UPI000A05E46B|nr:DUF167 domain-containing protein [Thermovibrio ammonificans]